MTYGWVWDLLPSRATESQSREMSTCVLVACDCSVPFLPSFSSSHCQSITECSLMIHTPGNSLFLFHLLQPECPWRPPCAMARSQNAQPVAGVKPVPKDLGKAQTLPDRGAHPSP